MTFKDFLKKIFSNKEEKPQPKNIELGKLGEHIKQEASSITAGFLKEKSEIENLVKQFSRELINQSEILKKVDLEKRKEQEKIKQIAKENLKVYAHYLEKHSLELEKINSDNLPDYLARLTKVINNFEASSRNTYEKATILVGKELGNTREVIKKFKQDINLLIEKNKPLLEKHSIMKHLETRLVEIKSLEKSEKDIKSEIENLDLRINDKKNAVLILETQVGKEKKSEGHKEMQEKIKDNEKAREELKKQVQKIKETIDFKALASIFHSSEKKMSQVRKYSENFFQAIEFDKDTLISLIKEANMPDISEQVDSLIKKQSEISNFSVKDQALELENEVKKVKIELESLGQEKSRIEKAAEKIRQSREQLISEIKSQAEKINILLSG